MKRMNVPFCADRHLQSTSYIPIGKDMCSQGKAVNDISNCLQLLSQILTETHFPLPLHYPQSIHKHFPQRAPPHPFTLLALALRYSSEEQTSGSLYFLPPLHSPSVHWEMSCDLSIPALAGSAGEKTQANLSLPIPGKQQQLERGSV